MKSLNTDLALDVKTFPIPFLMGPVPQFGNYCFTQL